MRNPFNGAFRSRAKSSCTLPWSAVRLVESRSSKPTMAFSSSAQSSAVRAIGPPWSREDANAIMPKRDTRP
jgi:hypothetical protein